MPFVSVRGRLLRETNGRYSLMDPGPNDAYGYIVLVPKPDMQPGIWSRRVFDYLKNHGVYQEEEGFATPADHSHAFWYKNGNVRVNVGEGKVEIEDNHGARDEVCEELVKLNAKMVIYD